MAKLSASLGLFLGLASGLFGCSGEISTPSGGPVGPGLGPGGSVGPGGAGGPAAGTTGDPTAGTTGDPTAGSGGGATAAGGATATAGGVTATAGVGGTTGTTEPTPPAPVNPGVGTIRRLNRIEYDNTVHDLLGTSLNPGESFQADDPGGGFDTVGAAASLSPAYVRDYEEAAHALVEDLYLDPARLATVVTCDVEAQGAACAETVLTAFARKAWRRPVTPEEVAPLAALVTTATTLGGTPTDGLKNALSAVLLSPQFIFKLEVDPDPASAVPRRLTDHELATRLSYALWSTMPDDALMAAADAGTLQTDAELLSQINRMLADPRAARLAENFAGQWLAIRDLATHEVEASAFPGYAPTLASSMVAEAQQFFMDFLSSTTPASQMLSARFTYLDQALATHYGLPAQAGVAAGQMWRADTSTVERSGLLTLGAILTATSFSTRTSPVKRGKFVMEQVLCTHIDDPPPDVVGLAEEEGNQGPSDTETLRQRMERHRDKPECIGCHSVMDPIGFGLETYDAIGRYRTTEVNGLPIDSSGELPDGTPFSGALELSAVLSGDTRFTSCLTQKLLIFSLGRLLDQPDDPVWVAHIDGTARDGDGTLGTLVRTLLASDAFRSRQSTLP